MFIKKWKYNNLQSGGNGNRTKIFQSWKKRWNLIKFVSISKSKWGKVYKKKMDKLVLEKLKNEKFIIASDWNKKNEQDF